MYPAQAFHTTNEGMKHPASSPQFMQHQSPQQSLQSDIARFSAKGKGLKGMDMHTGKSDPYLEFYRNANGLWTFVCRSHVCHNTVKPDWSTLDIDLMQLCSGNLNEIVLIKCFDYDANSAPDLIGECQVHARDLVSGSKMKMKLQGSTSLMSRIDRKELKRHKKYGCGQLTFSGGSIIRQGKHIPVQFYQQQQFNQSYAPSTRQQMPPMQTSSQPQYQVPRPQPQQPPYQPQYQQPQFQQPQYQQPQYQQPQYQQPQYQQPQYQQPQFQQPQYQQPQYQQPQFQQPQYQQPQFQQPQYQQPQYQQPQFQQPQYQQPQYQPAQYPQAPKYQQPPKYYPPNVQQTENRPHFVESKAPAPFYESHHPPQHQSNVARNQFSQSQQPQTHVSDRSITNPRSFPNNDGPITPPAFSGRVQSTTPVASAPPSVPVATKIAEPPQEPSIPTLYPNMKKT